MLKAVAANVEIDQEEEEEDANGKANNNRSDGSSGIGSDGGGGNSGGNSASPQNRQKTSSGKTVCENSKNNAEHSLTCRLKEKELYFGAGRPS